MITLGLIGCGRISEKHLNALEKLKDIIQVTSVCDILQDRAEKTLMHPACVGKKIKIYTNLKNMIENEKLDVVIISTPNGLHAPIGIQCAQAGYNIICEKPLAVKLSDGKLFVKECKKAGVKLFLVHQNRFNAPIQSLYQAIKEKKLGRIYMLSANVFWTRPQSYYDTEGNWHGTKEMDGGAFYTQATHYLDMIQWLAGGKPQKISSQLRTLARNIETEDTGIAIMEWTNPHNIIASINMSMLTYPKNLEGSITVLGEKGTIRVGGTAMNNIEHWNVENLPEPRGENYHTDSLYGFGHETYFKEIAEILNGKIPSDMIVREDKILDNLEILNAIIQSNNNNGKIIYLK